MQQDHPRMVFDVHLLKMAQDAIVDITSTVLWGKAIEVDDLTLEAITRWFLTQKAARKSAEFGVLYASKDVSRNLPRYYQALFDQNWKCLVARQVVPKAVQRDVAQLFESEDFVIFR